MREKVGNESWERKKMEERTKSFRVGRAGLARAGEVGREERPPRTSRELLRSRARF